MTPDHGYPRDRVEFYDERLARHDRADEGFYVDRANAVDGPVLEMACGSGRIYLDLLEAGVDADGFDLSADALDVLRENAREAGLDPTVWRADMTAFSVDRAYDLVTCPFNAFQHMESVDDQLAALDRVHEALAPGGEFVFDVFVPDFSLIAAEYGDWRTETLDYDGALHEYRTRTRIVDEVEQVFEVENELYDEDGAQVFEQSHRMSLLPKQQVELLARESDFADWSVTGDFEDEPLSDGDRAQVWTLRKASV